MNKVGIYYAYWVQEWDADFHPFIDKAANLGFDQLEINAGTVARASAQVCQDIAAHARERGITLSYCIGLPADYDVASAQQSVREMGIAYLQTMAQTIGKMGGGTLGGIIYGSWPGTLPSTETDRRPYIERSIASMRQAIKAAEDNAVVFNMEVVNRFEQFMMNTCEEAINYIEQVDSPNAKIMLDTFHMNIEEDSMRDALIRAGSHLGHFHIGENNRKPPGHGHIPWNEIGAALREIGYEGAIVMEPFLRPGGQVGRDIRVFRDLSVGLDMDAEAQNALQLIRDTLK